MKLYKYSVARGVDFSIPEDINLIERYRSRSGRTVFIVDREVESLEGKEDVDKEVKTIEVEKEEPKEKVEETEEEVEEETEEEAEEKVEEETEREPEEFKCEECGKTFESGKALAGHMSIHK